MLTFWRDHSLSIVSIGSGLITMLVCIPLAEGTAFDLISAVGAGMFGAGLVGVLAGSLREVNKPED